MQRLMVILAFVLAVAAPVIAWTTKADDGFLEYAGIIILIATPTFTGVLVRRWWAMIAIPVILVSLVAFLENHEGGEIGPPDFTPLMTAIL